MADNFFSRLLSGRGSDARTVPQLSIAASKGERRALEGLLQAAQSGNAEAQAELGFLYAKGLGTPQSTATAMSWYGKAADNGNLNAQFNLGVIYFKGDGHDIDLRKAMACFSKAAAGGHAQAASLIPVVQFAMQTDAMEQAAQDALGAGIVTAMRDAGGGKDNNQAISHVHGKALFEQGMVAATEYRSVDAVDLYTRSIEAYANPSPYINRAKIQSWRGRYYEAFQDLMEARKLDYTQGEQFLKEIDNELYKIKPLCQHYFNGNRESIVHAMCQAEPKMYGRAEFLDEIWFTTLGQIEKTHLWNPLRRFHFFNDLDNIRKFNGFEFYPEAKEYCESYPSEFIDQEAANCPDPMAYTLIAAQLGCALCLLDEQTMARFRESSLYRIQDEMMTNDFGLWGTFTSEDVGVIRDAEEFMAERGLLPDR